MGDLIDFKELLGAILYSIVGIIIFLLVSFIYDWITPVQVWKEIAEKQNIALAIVIAAMMVGISIIIGSAHG
jgi:putative membrane protein